MNSQLSVDKYFYGSLVNKGSVIYFYIHADKDTEQCRDATRNVVAGSTRKY